MSGKIKPQSYKLHFFDNIVSKAIRINNDPKEVKPDEIIIGVDFNREANSIPPEEILKIGQYLIQALNSLRKPKPIVKIAKPGDLLSLNRAQRRNRKVIGS